MAIQIPVAFAGGIATVISVIQYLASEGWTRYVLIVFVIGVLNLSGIYLIEFLVEEIFKVFGLIVKVPFFGQWSAIYILTLFAPVIFYAVKYSR